VRLDFYYDARRSSTFRWFMGTGAGPCDTSLTPHGHVRAGAPLPAPAPTRAGARPGAHPDHAAKRQEGR